jgi:hypothetical protein
MNTNTDTKSGLLIDNPYYPVALQYLEQWYCHDRYRVEAIRSGSRVLQAEALRELADAYSLGRSILMNTRKSPTCEVAGDAQFFKLVGELETVLEKGRDDLEATAWDFSAVVGQIFARKNGDGEKATRQLSAATKFLWFGGLERVRIYDRQAYRALLGKTPPPMTLARYRAYCARWEQVFAAALPDIQAACKALCLPSNLAWSIAGHLNRDTIGDIATEVCSPRFAERVFDRVLWLLGAELGAEAQRSAYLPADPRRRALLHSMVS